MVERKDTSVLNSFLLKVQAEKAQSTIELEIAQVEAGLLKQAKDVALGVVTVEDFGTYYKLPSGNWRGPGGNYGPETVLGIRLEEEFKKQQDQGEAK